MSITNDYSQHGEGRVINAYFKDKKGTLLSIGENDGKTLSNVLGLIEVGWKAHLIEPSEIPFNKMKALHEGNDNVKCYKYAISDKDGKVDFFESGEHLGSGDTSLLSTIKPSEISRWKGTCQFKKIQVDGLSFYSFLELSKLDSANLISIDCEGVDFDILKKIPLQSLNTEMVIIETNSERDSEVVNYMIEQKFKLHYKNFCNLIFVKHK